MNVYVVYSIPHDEVIKVFDSKEKAERYIVEEVAEKAHWSKTLENWQEIYDDYKSCYGIGEWEVE